MPWLKKGLKRAYACNAGLVLHLRERCGWTQFQLANAAGLSERLISKVESGKPISTRAIDLLATALSLPEEPIYPEDLISDPLKLAKEIVEVMHTRNKQAFGEIRHLLDENIYFHVAGDPAVLPFAGEYHGIQEVALGFESYYSTLEASEEHPSTEETFSFVAEGNIVVASGDCWLHPIGRPMESPIEVMQRMKFRCGKMYHFEEVFDTLKGAKMLEEAQVAEDIGGKTGPHFRHTQHAEARSDFSI